MSQEATALMERVRQHRPDAIFTRGGRTGRKVHLSTPTSSVLGCGHWTKHSNRHFRLDDSQVRARPAADFCEKCFPGLAS